MEKKEKKLKQAVCELLFNLTKNLRQDAFNEETARTVAIKFIVACYSESFGLYIGNPLDEFLSKNNSIYTHNVLRYTPPFNEYESFTFSEQSFNLMRELASFNWLDIPLEVIGTVYETAMDKFKRDKQNAYYTSFDLIHKTIADLFLNKLYKQLEDALERNNYNDLLLLKKQISSINVLDASCGTANYLIYIFNELYAIDVKISKVIGTTITVSPEQFHGIDNDEEAVELAKVMFWLANRINEIKTASELGCSIPYIDTEINCNIVCKDALTTDWNDIVPAEKLTYIVGNPPFMVSMPNEIDIFVSKKIDISACWVKKAAQMMLKNSSIEASLLLNNSICQGEQTAILWKPLINLYGIKINFAHRSFEWAYTGVDRVQVSCIIVGFSKTERKEKLLYYYHEDYKSCFDRVEIVDYINGFLLPFSDIYLSLDFPYDTNRPNAIVGTKNNQPKLTTDEKQKMKLNTSQYITANNILTGKKEYVENLLQTTPVDIIIVPRHSSVKRDYIPIEYIEKANIVANESVIAITDANLVIFGLMNTSLHKLWAASFGGRLNTLSIRYSSTLYHTFPIPTLTEQQKDIISDFSKQILSVRLELSDTLSNLYTKPMAAKLKKVHIELDNYIESIYFPNSKFLTRYDKLKNLCEMYKNQTKDLPLQLKHYRLEADLTKKEIADALGISEQNYKVAEKKNRLGDNHLKNLAKFYGKDFEEMRKGIKRN